MSEAEASQRYAVVTGANKGIGLEAVKQLAFNGITVILTARDAKRGLEAVEKLKEFELSGRVLFHQLDVTDPASVASLADFITTQFGKLDILVNNAAISGLILDPEELARAVEHAGGWNIPNELAKQILNDVEKLTEERVDEVLSEFMKDFKEGRLEAKGWPTNVSAYKLSKASMNAYTRILAKRFPNFRVNSIHPGYVKTDMTCNTGLLTVEEGAQILVTAALLPPDDKSSGLFISHEGVLSF
ncbi:(-)-isopiperitenone reductase-like isoform X2 [Ziziphus jujuba]|uniref:(-)-isopiperitenone reductase-like isoform X2 n=1 Tax=Ziziphus jujuba TaxID=326968 RepID=A0ABM3IR56_ZIZJJ|nr:(-)-isopiperitenone reductase-like isoform X2 [Ziziphus jujuba]